MNETAGTDCISQQTIARTVQSVLFAYMADNRFRRGKEAVKQNMHQTHKNVHMMQSCIRRKFIEIRQIYKIMSEIIRFTAES